MIPTNMHRYIIEWKRKPTTCHSNLWSIFAADLAAAQNYADRTVNRETSGEGVIISVKLATQEVAP